MKKITVLLIALIIAGCGRQASDTLLSPDGKLGVEVFVTRQNTLAYTVERDGDPVILDSDLGLQLTAADFTQGIRIKEHSPVKSIADEYRMRVGKKSNISYKANEQTITVVNPQQQELAVTFRVSNDGVAFRYSVTDPAIAEKQFVKEITSFHFAPDSKAWLQPIAPAQTGWSNVNPSYEENYQMGIPVGTPSTMGAGWVFPGLFNSDDHWVLVSEAGMDGSWHASRLHHDSKGGAYKLDIPQAPEIFTGGALLAHAKDTLISPWRIAAIGDLATVMESTLGTDVADPAIDLPADFVKPGHASWSWPLLKDDFTTFEVQKKFIDYAANMRWDYTLVDAGWDQKIGLEKLKELVDYAAEKNIGVLVWYNSSGDWNLTPQTPKSELLTPGQRATVFSRLRDIGVVGAKIDFFSGDGQSMIAYYVDLLKDAAQYNLLVNFHGATLPRGWQRTYPHLMTMEAIRGFEFRTFSQEGEDPIAAHTVMSLFTRNVFDPMDFTPMVFGDIPDIKRQTENSFELPQSVLMTSGIQHFAEIPEGMATAPDYVKNFLRELPREWDDVKFIDGYPGKYIVLARRAGDAWYIAGLNAEQENRTLELDLSFTGDKKGMLISGGDTARSFAQQQINSKERQKITLRPNAGFVLVLK
jgi:alpha-glucosidase